MLGMETEKETIMENEAKTNQKFEEQRVRNIKSLQLQQKTGLSDKQVPGIMDFVSKEIKPLSRKLDKLLTHFKLTTDDD